ncbi:MAG: hypothetical protein QM817_08320 [Archangium sp.]
MNAGEALAQWRERQGRAGDDDGAKIFWVALGPIRVPVPHPGQLRLHDLHHVVLGYETDLIGEMEISAYELRTGVKTAMVFVLCVLGVALGMFVAPLRTARAWKRGAGRRNLYGQSWAELRQWPFERTRDFMLGES